MERLKNNPKIIYGANVLVYYSFSTKKYEIKELTLKTHKLTEYLIKNDSKILIPQFVIDELNRVTFSRIVSDYVSKRKEISNLPKNPTFLFKIELESKIQKKFNSFLNKEWVVIENEIPQEDLVDKIGLFFDNLNNHPKSKEFLKLKKRNSFKPSDIDIKLIALSKQLDSPLVSNDYDLTFFARELLEKNLSSHIFSLSELDVFNN